MELAVSAPRIWTRWLGFDSRVVPLG